MAISLDIKSLLKRTLNQCGPVFFSKIEIKGTFVSSSHWRVCLGHGRVMRVCERCVSARLFTFETFFREYSFEFLLHRRKFTINLGLFSRTKKKKINMLPKLAYRSNHIVKWPKKKNDKEVRVLTTGYSQLVTHPVSNPVRPLLIYCTSLARSFKRSRNPSTSASASSTSVALSFNSVASSSIDA